MSNNDAKTSILPDIVKKKRKLKVKQKYHMESVAMYHDVIGKSQLGESYYSRKICRVGLLISYGTLNDTKKHLSMKEHIGMVNDVEFSRKVNSYFMTRDTMV